MKTRVSFADIFAPDGKRKNTPAQELKDLDVDRVDGVDKPATGRNFLHFRA